MPTPKHFNLLAVALPVVLGGCASQQSLYQWGSYEDQVHAYYAKSDSSPRASQIAALEANIEQARANNKPLPPGYFAHLGMLHHSSGNLDRAGAAFESEKTLFPEAASWINRLLAAIGRKP